MIRHKDLVFEDYFIDPVTAVITDKDDNVINQWMHQGRLKVSINGHILSVHCIQAHTKWGFKPRL